MADPTQDFWASDLVIEDLRTPLSILRQQASLLGPKTNNVLEGEVLTWADHDRGRIQHVLNIVAPALDGYKYELLRISHRADLYPVDARAHGMNTNLESEEQLIQWLKDILSSEQTKRVISALVAQSK